MSASHTRIVWTPPIACAPHPPGAVVRPEIVPPVAVREAIASRSREGGHVRAGSTVASRRRGGEATHVAAPARHAGGCSRHFRILATSAARATPVGRRPCHSGGPSGRVAAAATPPERRRPEGRTRCARTPEPAGARAASPGRRGGREGSASPPGAGRGSVQIGAAEDRIEPVTTQSEVPPERCREGRPNQHETGVDAQHFRKLPVFSTKNGLDSGA